MGRFPCLPLLINSLCNPLGVRYKFDSTEVIHKILAFMQEILERHLNSGVLCSLRAILFQSEGKWRAPRFPHFGLVRHVSLCSKFVYMGRTKLATKRIDNSTLRQETFIKRKAAIVKKAQELAVLCDIDLALLMFSPMGLLTSFASNGRIEDIFLKFIQRPDELKGGPIQNQEYLSQRLKQLKYERDMLEKMATIEALKEQLYKLNQRRQETQEKLRYYRPNVENISSVHEAGVYEQFLTKAIECIQLSKVSYVLLSDDIEQEVNDSYEPAAAEMENWDSISETELIQLSKLSNELLGDECVQQGTENYEPAAVEMENRVSITDEFADTNGERNELNHGTRLSLDFIRAQKSWILSGGEHS